jgi:hypothetical protein
MYNWLEQDLAAVDRSKTPWVVVQGHRPMYTSEAYTSDHAVAEGMKTEFEALLLTYKVDIFWAGHYHSYERICPVANDTCVAWGHGVSHFVIGSAGASLDTASLLGKDWSMFFDDDWGYARVTVANQTALHLEWIRNKDRTVVEASSIYKAGAEPKTSTGCTCQQPWSYTSESQPGGDFKNLYGCQNPDGGQKTWCKVVDASHDTHSRVDSTACKPQTLPNGEQFDYCDTPVITTKNGCTCLSPWRYSWNNQIYYGCAAPTSGVSYSWCYVSGECGTSGEGGHWDYCTHESTSSPTA